MSTDTIISDLGTPTNATLGYTTAAIKGTLKITGSTSCAGGCIHGYSTVATSGLSGFNFIFQTGSGYTAE